MASFLFRSVNEKVYCARVCVRALVNGAVRVHFLRYGRRGCDDGNTQAGLWRWRCVPYTLCTWRMRRRVPPLAPDF